MNKLIIRTIVAATIALGATVGQAQDTKPTSAAPENQVHGYLIANYTIKDQETFKKYMDAAGSLPLKYNGKVIIYDVNSRTLEGKPESVMAVAEFPSVAETERFYNSPEYSAAKTLRMASTIGSVVLAEGQPSSGASTPSGYMIANYSIKDQATFTKYMEAAGPLAPKFNVKVIIFDTKAKALEGKPEAIAAVAEFPSVAEAERFYNSPEYTNVRTLRIASTEGSVVMTQGRPLQQ